MLTNIGNHIITIVLFIGSSCLEPNVMLCLCTYGCYVHGYYSMQIVYTKFINLHRAVSEAPKSGFHVKFELTTHNLHAHTYTL